MTVLVLLFLLVGYAAYPLISTAQAVIPEKSLLTINAFSLPDGYTAGVLVEVRSGDALVKSGFAPLTVEGQTGTIYTIKVSNTGSYAFDHWQDGSKSNVKAVMLSEDATVSLAAFFEKISMSPNLTVKAVTANGEELHMWTTVRAGIQMVSSGLTPFSFSGVPGRTYQLTVGNQEANESASTGRGGASLSGIVPISIIFNHWQDDGNNKSATRGVTLPGNGTSLNIVGVYNKGGRVTLQDLGVLQLVSHDLYNTIRDGPHTGNIEDERLNLSTVLDHGEDQIAVGGEPRNSENIALHTVAVKLGTMYLDLIIDKKMSPQDAREQTVQAYLQMVAQAYQDTFHEPLPDPAPSEHEEKPDGGDNLTGDLSLRAVHSYVPGHIMVNGVDTMILDPSLRGMTLSDEDMQQLSKPLDGTFDPVFRNVTIFLPPPNPPPNTFTIDLFERDSSFAKQFGTDFSFEEFMNELKDGRFDANEKVTFYLREDIANGLMPPEEGGQEKDAAEAVAGSTEANATTVAATTTATGAVANETAVGSTPAAAPTPSTETAEEQVAAGGSNGQQPLLLSPPTTTGGSGGDKGDQEHVAAGEEEGGGSGSSSDEHDDASGGDGIRDGVGNNNNNDDDGGGDDNEQDSGRHHDDGSNNGGDDNDDDSSNGRNDNSRDDEWHHHNNNNNDDNDNHRLRLHLH